LESATNVVTIDKGRMPTSIGKGASCFLGSIF